MNIIELLPSTLQLKSKEYLKTYLGSCDEYCAFLVKASNDGSSESFVKQINILLGGNDDERHQGLSLLQTYVTQCTVRVFAENAVNWLSQCLKISLYKDAGDSCSLSLHVFKTILGMSVKFPDVAKEVAKQIVPKFLLEHVKRRQKQLVAAVQVLQCVEVCMKNYGGPTGEFRNDIANVVCRLLESGCATVAVAARCFALLPHIGSGGSQGVTHKTAWGQQQLVLVAKIHEILDDLFASINELQTYPRPKIELPGIVLNISHHVDPSPIARAQRFTKQFAGLAHFLQAMLLGSFPVIKTVKPGIIMSVVCRCLAVTHMMLANRVSVDSQALMSVLPLLHTAALHTLDALIHCCGRNLILYGRTICRLILQVIKSTSTDDWPYAVNKPHKSLRVTVLKTLSLWLTIARSSSSVEIYAEDILTLILVDIQSEKQSIMLNLSTPRKEHRGKKTNKRQMSLSVSGQDHSEKLGNVLANRHLCAAALHAVENILQVAGASIKPELHKVVQRTVLGLVIRVTQSCNDMPIPYSDTKCRLGLYQLLHTLCAEPHPSLASPVQYAVHLFSAGLKDSDVQVQCVCQKALSSIDKIIRPNAPSLGFPLQPTEHQLHAAVHLNSDLDRPLSSLANKDGYIVLRLVQEGGSTSIEHTKHIPAESIRRFSSDNNITAADYQVNTATKDPLTSEPASNTEERETYMETDENYYGEEYEDGNDEDEGGGGGDVDDEENYNYEENIDDNYDDGADAGEDESDIEVISLSSGGEEEEEEENEDIEEEEEEEEEEEYAGVDKHIDDIEDNVLPRLTAAKQYNSTETRPTTVEKRSLHFEEQPEQKRFKPCQENFVSVNIQVLQPEHLNKNICTENDISKLENDSVKPESEIVAEPESEIVAEPESDIVAEPESDIVAKPESDVVAEPESEGKPVTTENNFEKPESDFVEPENDVAEPENDIAEPENDVAEPENDFVKPENDSVIPENDSDKPENDSVKPDTNMEIDSVEQNTIQDEDPERQLEPEAKKSSELPTDNGIDNEFQQSEPNGCVQSVTEDEVSEKNEDSKVETVAVSVTEQNVVNNETEVDSVCSNQPESPSVKETVSETTIPDSKTNNIESNENNDDEKLQETKCNSNAENECSAENGNNVENKLDVCKNVNTISDDKDDNINEDEMIKDFADVVENLV